MPVRRQQPLGDGMLVYFLLLIPLKGQSTYVTKEMALFGLMALGGRTPCPVLHIVLTVRESRGHARLCMVRERGYVRLCAWASLFS